MSPAQPTLCPLWKEKVLRCTAKFAIERSLSSFVHIIVYFVFLGRYQYLFLPFYLKKGCVICLKSKDFKVKNSKVKNHHLEMFLFLIFHDMFLKVDYLFFYNGRKNWHIYSEILRPVSIIITSILQNCAIFDSIS